MEGPASKRIKMESCLICNNSSQFTRKREAYTELLINHLLPPSQRDKANSIKVYDFCGKCSDVLENLFQMKEGLEFILNSIKSSIESIKFSILKNGSSGNFLIDNFRRIAVKDFCPKVRMYKNNSLISNEKKTEENSGNELMDDEVSSSPYTYEDYDEPISPAVNQKDDNNQNKKIDNSISQLTGPAYSKSNYTKSGDLASYSVVSKSTSLPSKSPAAPTPIVSQTQPELKKPHSSNIEDSVITVFEPPKFSSSQWQVYYENYKDMFKCKFCSTIMKGENLNASLARHINVIHAKNSRFKCGICFAIFFSKSKCRSHIGECHYEMFNSHPPAKEKEKDKISTEPVSKTIVIPPPSTTLVKPVPLYNEQIGQVVKKGVAKKKTTGIKRNIANVSVEPSEESLSSTSSGGKYSDEKIRSEVIINIDSKSKYNLMEDVVKFEPWDESSIEFNEDPLSKSPEMVPTEEPEACDDTKEHKEWSRPMLSYAQLIILAIKNSKCKEMGSTVTEICNFISTNYPFFKTESDLKKKIQRALYISRKYLKAHLPKIDDCSSVLKQTLTRERNYTINDEALVGKREVFQMCFKDNSYAMAYPERLEEMIETLGKDWADSEENYVLKDSIDIVDGIGVKIDEDEEATATFDSPNDKLDNFTFDTPWNGKSVLRPTLSYCHLAFLAFSNSKSGLMRTELINDFIRETFPFYRLTPQSGNWRSQVSKVLSSSQYFTKLPGVIGPYIWKLEETNLPALRADFKKALMKAVLNFHFSLANPDKLEELLQNALGDEIDMDFVKTCIRDFSMEDNEDTTYQNAGDKYFLESEEVEEEGQEVYLPESEELVEEDTDVMEIFPANTNTRSNRKQILQVKTDVMEEPSGNNLQIRNVVGRYQQQQIVIPIPIVSMNAAPIMTPSNRIIEIVEGGNSCVYRINDDSTITLVERKH